MTEFDRTGAIALAAALALMLSACEQYEPKGGKTDAASVTKAIKAVEASENRQFKAKALERLAGNYTDDAYFVGPDGSAANGSTAIRKAFADGLNDPDFKLDFASDRVEVASAGDMATTRGHFTEQYTDPKTRKTMTSKGSYLTVYHRQQDGSWKITEDFAVADPASVTEVKPGKPATRARMVSM